MPWIGFEKLAAALEALAKPVSEAYGASSEREADKAVGRSEREAKHHPKTRPEAAPNVARATAVGQILSIEAEPPLAWIAPRAAWRCEGEATRVSVKLADGTAARHTYERGTLIPVAAGMVHFPRE